MAEKAEETQTSSPSSDGAAETLPAASTVSSAPPSSFRTVDEADYDIVGDLAKGGMGRIRHARDRRHGRPVAIKELLKSSSEARQRFRREALITARLQHPAIVPLYEAGTWPSGEPFYSMKLVEGDSLDKVIARRTSLAERIALLPRVITVAEAIAYAHDRHIIHRDLKPSNILVGDLGETVVIDWGLAKEIGERDVAEVSPIEGSGSGEALTVAGRTMGTPAYMPPEQAHGGEVDERADVYALGAVLYHLLTGRPPYGDAKGVNELLDRLRSGPPTRLATLVPDAPRDLVTIVEKAMARDRDARYPRARELASDLRRFEAGQLVGAHAYSAREILGRWVRRHRGIVAVIAIAAVLAAIGATISFRRVARERDTARRFAIASEAARRDADDRVEQLSLDRARVLLPTDPSGALALARAVPPTSRWSALAALTARVAEAWGVSTEVTRADNLIELAVSADGTRVAWAEQATVFFRGPDGATVHRDVAGPVTALAFSPDGTMLGIGTRSGDVYYGASGLAPERLGTLDEAVVAIDLAQTGLVAVAGENASGWWDLAASPRRLNRMEQVDESPGASGGVARSDRVLIVRPAGTIDVGSRLTAKNRLRLAGYWNSWTRQPGELTPDGEHLLYLSADRALMLLDLTTGARRQVGEFDVRTVAVWVGTVDGYHVVVDILGGTHVWSPDGGSRDLIAATRATTNALAVCRLGTRIAIGFDDGAIAIVDPRRGLERTLKGHVGNVFALAAFTEGGKPGLVSAGHDGTIRRWTLDTPEVATDSVGFRPVTAVAVTHDGTTAAAGEDGVVQLWNAHTKPQPIARGVLVDKMMLSADERYLVWGLARGNDSGAGLVDLSDPSRRSVLAGCSAHPVFAAKAPRFACHRAYDGAVLVWDTTTWTSSGVGFAGASQVDSVGISADGQQLAVGSMTFDFALRWWDRTTDRQEILESHQGNQWAVAFRDVDATLLSINGARALTAWQPAQGRSATIDTIASAVRLMATSTRLVATGAEDGTIGIWDLDRGRTRQLRALSADDGSVEDLRVSSREDVIVARYNSGRVVLWNIASGAGVPLPGTFRSIALSSDGRQLAAGRKDGLVLRLTLPETTPGVGDEGWTTFALEWRATPPVPETKDQSIDKALTAATAAPTDAGAQRRAADGLRLLGRMDEALVYYRRAAALGDGRAKWRVAAALALAAAPADRDRVLVDECLRIAMDTPWSDTDFELATVTSSPVATMAQKTAVLERWAATAGDDPERLNQLAYIAMGAGALDVADRIITRVLAKHEDAFYLDTAAEVAHLRGDRERAIALSERAIAKAPSEQELRENLRRFRRGHAEPARGLLEHELPTPWAVAPTRIDLPPTP